MLLMALIITLGVIAFLFALTLFAYTFIYVLACIDVVFGGAHPGPFWKSYRKGMTGKVF